MLPLFPTNAGSDPFITLAWGITFFILGIISVFVLCSIACRMRTPFESPNMYYFIFTAVFLAINIGFGIAWIKEGNLRIEMLDI